MAESTILTTFVDPQTHSIPKLEDFLGGDLRYSDNSQSETQDSSSLSQIYDPRHHHHPNQNQNQNQTGFYSDNNDFKTMPGFQTAFSTNSGSEVDDSASIARTHLPGEYLGHVVESSGPELGFHGGALSLGDSINNANQRSNDTNQITEHHHYQGNNNNIDERIKNNSSNSEKRDSEKDKAVVAVETSDCSNKKVADTFGQRTSIYRGVTRSV